MIPARSSLVLNDKAVAIDKADGAQCGALDVCGRGLVVDDLLRAILAAEDNLEVVLEAVDAIEVEFSIWSGLEIKDILVAIFTRIYPTLASSCNIVNSQLDN